jgi:hexosaminidase
MKNILYVVVISLLLASCAGKTVKHEVKEVNIIPVPASMELSNGTFELNEKVTLEYPEELSLPGDFLNEALANVLGKPLSKSVSGSGEIKLSLNSSFVNEEAYRLEIKDEIISIEAATSKGIFYGVQSLIQLLPVELNTTVVLPTMKIEDEPRFAYRGMHLDVGRHMFPVKFIKKYIDMLAMYKMNTFHWHLTEDQGWRIQIMKYPKLTEISSYRKNSEGEVYGGFYTQEEVKEVVAYAAENFITVIPEIEMPGHSVAVLAAYPELACTDGPFEVQNQWGVFEDVYCAGKEETFEFLQNVLLEVMELFPSTYIHIGGDECPKARWEDCKECQKRIREEGLENEHELQSYFIKRIEKFLMEHDRRLIGWDEILEGGLAPEATVMSWRGEKGGIQAAKEGHDVVMTPTSYCYFDYYQGDPQIEPKAIGGYLTVEKVYSYDPIPAELTEKEAKHILGAQGNVWTEYIPTEEKVEYMMMPRMMALSEVVWSPLDKKDFADFMKRFQAQREKLDKMNINYSKSVYNVAITAEYANDELQINLKGQIDGEIRYTLDGTDPVADSPLYKGAISIDKSLTLKTAMFEGGVIQGGITKRDFYIHKAFGKKVTLKNKHKNPKEGVYNHRLVDGLKGSDYYNDGYHLGFRGDDMEAVIDLGSEMEFTTVKVNAFQRRLSWIFRPEAVSVFVSDDNKKFKKIGVIEAPVKACIDGRKHVSYDLNIESAKGRYIKVLAESMGEIPDWHTGAGNEGWIFIDEIIVE